MSDHHTPRDPDEEPSATDPPDPPQGPPPVYPPPTGPPPEYPPPLQGPAPDYPPPLHGPAPEYPPPQYPPPEYPPPEYPPPPAYPTADYGYGYGPQRQSGTNSKAIIALVCGIAGFALCPLIGVAAILVGGTARREIQTTGQSGYGLALIGVVLGWIEVAFMVGLLLLFVSGVAIST